MERPELNNKISVEDFRDFYWLKEELIAFCRLNGIKTTGGKHELVERISTFLETGRIVETTTVKQKQESKFNWNNTAITLNTVITDNYKNSENVRTFMTKAIGSHFRFNTEFMKWTKSNIGKTMREAIAEWNRIYEQKKNENYKTEISPQFEYNTYIRSFLADNKDKTIKDAIRFWKLKRNRRGDNVYRKEDLLLKD